MVPKIRAFANAAIFFHPAGQCCDLFNELSTKLRVSIRIMTEMALPERQLQRPPPGHSAEILRQTWDIVRDTESNSSAGKEPSVQWSALICNFALDIVIGIRRIPATFLKPKPFWGLRLSQNLTEAWNPNADEWPEA